VGSIRSSSAGFVGALEATTGVGVKNAGAGGVGVAVKACGLGDYIFPKFSECARQFCQIALTMALKAGRLAVGSVGGREEAGRGGAGAAAATGVAGLSSGHASAGADPP
jgi:hypothetical protein